MNVYIAIVERFLAVFYPKAVYEEVVVSTEASGENFETRGKSLLEPGWTAVLGTGKDVLLPTVTDGKSYRVISVNAEDKKTTPPSRYTEETLLSAMKNAGRFVEDANEAAILNSKEVEGLGTGRTRPAIIENIKHRGYFVEQKKYIYPTEKCCDLFDVLPNTTLSSPSLTAQFEQMIQDVEDGNMTKQEYMDRINEEVQGIIEKLKLTILENQLEKVVQKLEAQKVILSSVHSVELLSLKTVRLTDVPTGRVDVSLQSGKKYAERN